MISKVVKDCDTAVANAEREQPQRHARLVVLSVRKQLYHPVIPGVQILITPSNWGEKYPTISPLGPLLAEIRPRLNSVKVTHQLFVERVLTTDMHTRYQDRRVTEVLNISSFLDPRFKTVAHLTEDVQEKTVKKEMLEHLEVITSSSLNSAEVESADIPPTKRKKPHPLQLLLGTKLQDSSRRFGGVEPPRTSSLNAVKPLITDPPKSGQAVPLL